MVCNKVSLVASVVLVSWSTTPLVLSGNVFKIYHLITLFNPPTAKALMLNTTTSSLVFRATSRVVLSMTLLEHYGLVNLNSPVYPIPPHSTSAVSGFAPELVSVLHYRRVSRAHTGTSSGLGATRKGLSGLLSLVSFTVILVPSACFCGTPNRGAVDLTP